MTAQGGARPERPNNPSCKSVGYCMCGIGRRAQGARGQWGCYGGVSPDRVLRRGVTLFGRMCVALSLGCYCATIGSALACCFLLCCFIAMPCPFTPGDPMGQRSPRLLTLKPGSRHHSQILVGRYPWSPRSSVMSWATSGSLGTRPRHEPPVGASLRVTLVGGMRNGYEYDYDHVCMYV